MAGTRTTAALDIRSVTREFPGVIALADVDLRVEFGEIHGVIGENGAGKSTLMAIASGALEANSGDVIIDGVTLDNADPQAARALGLAIVRQEPALLPDLSVAENLYLAVQPSLRPAAGDILTWANRQLKQWGDGLSFDASDRVEQLQPQQRFIVEICRALSQDPQVLVLDEPTEHLLRPEVEILFQHVRAHAAKGRAVVYISHRINEVKEITDRLTVLRNGRTVGTSVTQECTTDQIVNLIIGRDLDVFFPDKTEALRSSNILKLENFHTRGLHPSNVTFKGGEIVGLAGIDGNGQREFLRSLAGIARSRGAIEIGGRRIERYGHRSAVANDVVYVPGDRHNEGILTGLSVRENLSLRNFKSLGTAGWVSARAETTMAERIIQDYAIKTPSTETMIDSLSGGNQQKVLIGSALARGPKVLLVDEPTQGVDIGAKSEIYALMRAAANEGAIVIVWSSDASELAGISDRVLVFSRGQVVREIIGDSISEREITQAALTSDVERGREASARRRLLLWLAGDHAPLWVVSLIIAAMALVGVTANPLFLGANNIGGILALTGVLALVSFGQLLVLLTGGIDLSTGPLVGLVAIIASFYLVDGASLVESASGWLIIFGTALLVGFVNWALIDLVRLSPIVATLVTYMAIQGVSFIFRPSPGGFISSSVTDPISAVVGPVPVTFVVVLAMGIGLNVALKRSRPGVSLRAVGSKEEAARVNGLSPKRVRMWAYLGCSLLSALAGILFMAQTATGDARAGSGLTLLGITAAVVGGASIFGGRGSFIGVLLGALMVQMMNSLTVFLRFSPDWQYYLVGAMTLGAVALYSIARQRAASRH
ncbi:ATP-binding cassette domain-containing protein [Arthrobacter sp. CC3]|uniref:ATP-binding cassette domain-containing protein n=1 Tax=Arthrobacter sp. CC3 TaxID=3029185 RepID=UPI00326363C4